MQPISSLVVKYYIILVVQLKLLMRDNSNLNVLYDKILSLFSSYYIPTWTLSGEYLYSSETQLYKREIDVIRSYLRSKQNVPYSNIRQS